MSMMAAFYTFTKQARLWALHEGKTPDVVAIQYADAIGAENYRLEFERLKSITEKNESDQNNETEIEIDATNERATTISHSRSNRKSA